MMYFREDAKRPLSISRKQFEENWDRAFSVDYSGEKEDGEADRSYESGKFLNVANCSGCGRLCYKSDSNGVATAVNNPQSKVVSAGYCTMKRAHIFEVEGPINFCVSYYGYGFPITPDSKEEHIVLQGVLDKLIFEWTRKRDKAR